MKLLWCTLCLNLVQMKVRENSCDCGNVKGRYIETDNERILREAQGISEPKYFMTIAVKSDKLMSTVKIVGIANSFLENGHMHFDDGLPGGFNDDPNPNSLFNQNQSAIIMVDPLQTHDVITYEEAGLE